MTPSKIQAKTARLIQIKKIIATLETEFKEIKDQIIQEAESRSEEHVPTEGGGWSWRHPDADGNIVCVTQPVRRLKTKLDPESTLFKKVRDLVERKFSLLFAQVPAYQPIDGFRDLAFQHLDSTDAKKLIKLMSSDSAIQVSFEVAESEAQ